MNLDLLTIKAEKFLDKGIAYLDNILIALLIFFIGKWVIKRIVKVAQLIMGRSNMDATVANFLGNLMYGGLIVVVLLASLSQLGVNTNSFVAVLGGAAVAIGVSLKDQLSNFSAGVVIIVFRPFNRGDTVEIAGKTGVVQNITLVNTRLITTSNNEIIIPNGDITTSTITNFSMRPTRRVEVMVGISYDADIRQARQIMLDIANNHEKALKNPEPIVRVTNLGDNAVNLTLYVWANNTDWFELQCEMLERIKYGFDEHHIDIPFPQRNVHVEGLERLIKQKSV